MNIINKKLIFINSYRIINNNFILSKTLKQYFKFHGKVN